MSEKKITECSWVGGLWSILLSLDGGMKMQPMRLALRMKSSVIKNKRESVTEGIKEQGYVRGFPLGSWGEGRASHQDFWRGQAGRQQGANESALKGLVWIMLVKTSRRQVKRTPKPWGHCVPGMQVSVSTTGVGETALKAQSVRKLQVEKEQFSSGQKQGTAPLGSGKKL